MTDPLITNNRHYYESVRDYPHDHRGVKWSSAQSQFLRFKILCKIAKDIFNSNILDVGCGLGHLVDYLISNQFSGTYKGIDIVDQMIINAKKRHPSYHFEANDIDSISVGNHEYVLASGIFAFVDIESIQKMLPLLFLRATKGLAFNCLSSLAPNFDGGLFYQNPAAILQLCQSITPRVILRHDYMQHDFTIYMYK